MSLMLDLTFRVRGQSVHLRIPEDRVFVPHLGSLLGASQLRIRPGETFCDVGAGSGFFAILAAKLGAAFAYGVDISADAAANARRNARLNGVADRCRFFAGDFAEAFKRFDRKVDLIYSSLPNTPTGSPLLQEPAMIGAPRISRFLQGGETGAELNLRMFEAARAILSPSGRIQLNVVAWSDAAAVENALRREGFRLRTLAKASIPIWGQRCNVMGAYFARALEQEWRLSYRDLPEDPSNWMRIIQASREAGAGRERSFPAEVGIRVNRDRRDRKR